MGPTALRGVRGLAGAVLGALAVACADPALQALEARYPALAEAGAHRLAEGRPYYLPVDDTLILFTCRWPDGARIPLDLPEKLNAKERRQIQAALTAWEGAGLGVSFEEQPDALGAVGPGIEIRLLDQMLAYGANTTVDCAVDPEGLGAAGDTLPARVVFASIHVARDDPRLTGTVLHELGHALGYQGHPRNPRRARGQALRTDTVMGGGTELVRKAGERVSKGEPFRDLNLQALYALPSGSVLERSPLPAGRTRAVDWLMRKAAREGLIGPLVRVGDMEGRLAWLEPDTGRALTVRLEDLAQARDEPEKLRVKPSRRVARMLDEDA